MGAQKRKIYIDVLRIMGTLMIMFNHTSTFGFALYTVNTQGILYWIYLVLAILVKVAVPIFFMISGGLLLEREEKVSTVLSKRFTRFCVVLFVGSLIHYFYFSNWQFNMLSVEDFARNIYSGGIVTPYWYLYSYLGFLLMLPILRKLAWGMNTNGYVYLITLYFFMRCMSVVRYAVWHGNVDMSPYFSFFIMGDNIFFPLLGYFIECRLPEIYYEKKYAFRAVVATVTVIGVCAVLTNLHSKATGLWDEGSTQTFFNTFIFIPAGCIYFLVKYWFKKHRLGEKIEIFLCTVGSCTFGVYLFETIYREETKFIFWKVLEHFPTLIACIAWIGCAFVVGVVVSFGLKKLPFVKKLL